MNLKRVRNSYKNLSVFFITALIFFALLNGFAAAVLWHRARSGEQQQDPVSSRYGALVNMVYPHRSASEVKKLLQETWDRGPSAYESFTQYKESPFQGEYVNVDADGFRHGHGQAPWPPAPERFNIFIFGGSTTFGFGVSDDETIPSQLQNELRKSNPSAAVYNFGRGYFYSTQERILFEQLLIAGHVPDAAIFIDGINEVWSFWDPKLLDEWKDEPAFANLYRQCLNQSTAEKVKACIGELPSVRLIREWLGQFQNSEKESEQSLRHLSAPTEGDKSKFYRYLLKVLQRWLDNKEMIEAVGERFSVRTFFVWQPSPAFQYDLRYHPFLKGGTGWEMPTRMLYTLVEDLSKRNRIGGNFLYYADMQAEKKEPLYVDRTHYTAKMSAEIARRLAASLIEHDLFSGVPPRRKRVVDELLAGR